ncbi:hypothetical protein V1511DRAFT_498287 [Dipodascopsis uninucleata]
MRTGGLLKVYACLAVIATVHALPMAINEINGGRCESPVLLRDRTKIEEHGNENLSLTLLSPDSHSSEDPDTEYISCTQAALGDTMQVNHLGVEAEDFLEEVRDYELERQFKIRTTNTNDSKEGKVIIINDPKFWTEETKLQTSDVQAKTAEKPGEIKQILDSLLCLLPQKARRYTTCKRSVIAGKAQNIQDIVATELADF